MRIYTLSVQTVFNTASTQISLTRTCTGTAACVHNDDCVENINR